MHLEGRVALGAGLTIKEGCSFAPQTLVGAADLREEGRTLIVRSLQCGLDDFFEASPPFGTVRHGR